MAIEIDFGRELGRLAFPEGITDEQAQSYVRENYQAIRQGLLDRRRQELAAETESEEAAKFRAGEVGTLETVGAQAGALPRAFTEGTGLMLQGAERAAKFFPPPTVNPFTGRPIQQTVEPEGPGALTQAGRAIREFGAEAFPSLPGAEETIPAQVMGGVGSTLSVLPGALVGGPIGAGVLYGLQAGEAGAEDADRVINQRIAEALAAGDYDTASDLRSRAETLKNRAFLATAPIGAVTEGALGAAGKIPGMRSGAAGRSTLGKYSANLVERLIPQTASKRVQEMARGGIEGAVSEGLQESLEQTLGNMAAKSIYDPERGIMDGVAEAGFIGGASGGLVGGVVGSKRDINLANAVVAANGADPKNPLPLSNATVTGIEDTTPTEGYAIEPEITEEDVRKRQEALGLKMPPDVTLPAPAGGGVIEVTGKIPTITPTPEPAPTPAPAPAPAPAPTPAAAPAAVSPETGLTTDEQDELDQLIAVEDSGMLSEDQAETLESYRRRLAIKAMLAAETTTTPENAVQEQGSDEGVLRREGSQVGLQEVDRGGRPAEGGGTQVQGQAQGQAEGLTPLTDQETKDFINLEAQAMQWGSDYLTPDEQQRYEELGWRIDDLRKAGWSFDEQAGWTAPGQAPAPAPAAVTPSPVIQAKLDPDNVVRDALQAAGNDPVKAAAMIVADLENITGRELRASYQEAVNRLQKMVQKPAPAPATKPESEIHAAKLPKELAGAKPRYNFATAVYQPTFASDFDRAAFILAQTTPSKRDSDYLAWAKKVSGLTENQIRQHGNELRFQMRQQVRQTPGGTQQKPAALPVAQQPITAVAVASAAEQRPAVTAPAPAPAPAPGTVQAPKTARDLAEDLALLRAQKPRPLKKLYGPNPTEKQKEAYKAAMSDWNKQYRKVAQLHKRTLDQENANRTSKVRPASPGEQTQSPAAAATPMQEGIDNIKYVSEPVAQARGGGMDAKDAKEKLVQQLERAVEAAPADSDQQYRDLISAGQTDLEERFKTVNDKNMGEGFEAKYRKAHELGKQLLAKYGPSVPKVTIEIPGDGTYTVANTKQALNQVLDKARKLNTSMAKGPVRAPAAARKPERPKEALMRMAKQATQVYGKNAAAKLREQANNADLDLTDEQRNDLRVVADMLTPVAKSTAQSAIDAIDKINKGLSENQYSDPLFLTPLAKLVLQIAKSLIKAGIAVDQAIRQAIAQAREQLPDDPTNDAQLEERLIRDAEYTAAVASGDMAAAQRMVDEAAYAAGYDTRPYYHGTNAVWNEYEDVGASTAGGRMLRRDVPGAAPIFVSSDPDVAESYGENVKKLFIDFGAPGKRVRIDANGSTWRSVYDQVANAFNEGAQSVLVSNVVDSTFQADVLPSDVVSVIYPEQIKSADPVTRDDQGNIVPLSQRFQSSTADIRGSAAGSAQLALQNAIATTSIETPAQQTAGVQAAAEAQSRDLGPNPSGKPATLEEATAEVRDAIGQLIESITPKAGFTGGPSASDSLKRLLREIPPAVLQSAALIAQRVYRETRDWAKATQAGIEEIFSRIKVADIEDTRAGFSEFIQGVNVPGSVPATPPQPAAGQERVDSRGYFTGQINPETVENWQTESKRVIDSFGTDMEAAFRWAATTDMGADAREFVFKQIMERAFTQIARANNPIELARAEDLLRRVQSTWKSSGTQLGQAFAARAAAIDSIWYLHPLLAFRDLVRERQAQLPFPQFTSDQVRQWLQASGRQAIEELRLQMQDANNAFGREFRRITKDVLRREDINWADILTASDQRQGSMQYRILEEILSQPGLRNLPPRGISEIVKLFSEAWGREQERIFRNEFRKQVPLPTVKKDDREKIFRSIPRILRYSNIAMMKDGVETRLLWDQAFRNAVAPQFGVAAIDGTTARKLTALAQKAQSAAGINRDEIVQQMFRLMQKEGGINWKDILRDYWYAAVLSGTRTQVDNALNIANGALNTAMFAGMAGTQGGKVLKAAGKGLSEAIKDFWPILWKGELYRSVSFNPDVPGNSLEGLQESRNLFLRGISQLKYVSRLMQALDHMTALMSDSASKAYTLAKTDPKLLETYLLPSATTVADARARAIAEGTRPELVNRRTREIIEEALPLEVLLTARDIRQMSTFTETPQGLAGAIYQGVNAAERQLPGLKFLSGTSFVRFASNYANELLNYFAPVALWRWYQSAPGRQDTALGLKYSEARRDLLLSKLALGTALTGFAAALFLGDDDDEKKRAIDITGSFKSLSPEKRNQLLAEGRQPYSIRVGDTYISYRQLGFGGVLGAIGELRDQQLFSPEKYSKQGLADKLLDGFVSGALIIKDASSIAALTEFLGFANAYKYDVSQTIEKATPKYLSRLAGSVIPNIMKEADAWIDSSIYRAEPGNLGMEYFLQQVPFARQSIGPGPILNVLGEPVQVERYPYSRWLKFRKEDKAWNTLGQLASKGVFMPTPNITVTVKENGERRRMNRDEAYTYQKDVGQRYRTWIERNGDRLLNMKPDDAAEVIDKAADRMRADAREKIQQKVRR